MDVQSRHNPYEESRIGYGDRSFGGGDRGGMRGGGGNRPSRQDAHRRLRESVSGHRTGLPKKLLDLFAPRPPLPFLVPIAKKGPKLPYSGVAQWLQHFAGPEEEEYAPTRPEGAPADEGRVFRNPELTLQARIDQESRAEKKVRLRVQRMEQAKRDVQEASKGWDPKKDTKIEGDPYKTLFVGRISYDVTERNLKREFEEFGLIKRIRLVHDTKTGKPRGYAFIEFESKRDMNEAWNMAEGMKIEGRRITVDVEKGRTVDDWKPRRLGGGLGGLSRVAREAGTSDRDAGFREAGADRDHRSERERGDRREPERDGRDRYRDRHEYNRMDRFRDDRDRPRERAERVERAADRADHDRPHKGMREREGGKDRDRDRGRGHDWERERKERRRHIPRDHGEEREHKRARHLEDGELEHHDHRRRDRD